MANKDKSDLILEIVKELGKKIDKVDEKVDNFGGRLDTIEIHNRESRKNAYDRIGSLEQDNAVMKKDMYGNGKKGICEKIDDIKKDLKEEVENIKQENDTQAKEVNKKLNEINKIRFMYMGGLVVVIFVIEFLIRWFMK